MKKRCLAVLLCLLFWAGAAVADVKTTSKVRLRTGPATSYRIITAIPKNTVLAELYSVMYDEQQRPWHWVEWKGQDGWLCGDYAVKVSETMPAAAKDDPLAESRWIGDIIPNAGGTEANPVDFGGCELWLFPDGTAHWLVRTGEGYLSQNPVGHWMRTEDDALVFYQTESIAEAADERLRRFTVTSEGLRTPLADGLTIHLEPYDVTDRWLPLPRDALLGDWTLYAGETEGRTYTAAEEGIDATLRFTEAPKGQLQYAYSWDGALQKGTAAYHLNCMTDGSDLMTAWAPWYLDINLQKGENIRAFLLYDTMLRVERTYKTDGTLAVSIQDYVRMN